MSKWLDRYLKEIALSTADKTDKKDISSELSVLSVSETCVSTNYFSDFLNTDDSEYPFEERAAIMEFDAGLSRDKSERFAKLDMENYLSEKKL